MAGTATWTPNWSKTTYQTDFSLDRVTIVKATVGNGGGQGKHMRWPFKISLKYV